MTRPRKGEDHKRTLMVYVLMTPPEKQKLFLLAAEHGLTPSDYIRSRTIDAKPLTRTATPDRAAFIAAVAELGKIGSNVNQIARALNRRSESGETLHIPVELIEHALQSVDAMTRRIVHLLEQ